MRRGLMAWNKDELPIGTLDERIARLRARMSEAGLDAFVVYTNFVRPSAVSYLTGFTPYWSDGILLVRASGDPVFATALSKRVANWIRTTSPVAEIVNAPRPGAALGARLAADSGVQRVGVLELDALPAGIHDDLVGAAPAVELIDASAQFADIRRGIDRAERDLLLRADALATAALGQVNVAKAGDAGTVAGLVEKRARLDGAEEAQIAVAADFDRDRRMIRATGAVPLADRFALRASVAYKGSWVRRSRTFARDVAGAQAVARADAWFGPVLRSIEAGKPLAAQLAAQVGSLAGAELTRWMAESCVGSYPLQVIAAATVPAGEGPADGAYLVLTVELSVDGVPWIGAAPAIVGGHSETVRATA